MQTQFASGPRFIALLIAALFCTFWLPGHALAQTEPAAGPLTDADADAQTLLLPASQDAAIAEQTANTNFGSQPELRVSETDDVEFPFSTWSLVQWDLSDIPPGSTINNADLGLYQTTGSTVPLLIARVLGPWNEATVTWSNRPESTIIDRTWTPPNVVNQYVRFDTAGDVMEGLVNQWVNSAGNPPNFGLLLRPDTPPPASLRIFASSEVRARPPVLRVNLTLPPIRVCYEAAQDCKPAAGAEVFLEGDSDPIAVADASGLIDSDLVALGDALWARVAVATPGAQSTLYNTSGPLLAAEAANFQLYTDTDQYELRLVVRSDQPLLLYDLDLSAQWYLEDDPARVEWLRANLVRASDFLYDSTEGQFALGTVTVRQMYEGWDEADIKLHTSNVLHPNANVGGIVAAETPDIAPTVPISYAPGSIFIGSYWNRFGAPPNQEVTYDGQVVPPAAMADDWAIALAHEFGHYLLFLFDTYTDQNGISSEEIASECAGSAMGNAYLATNHAFIGAQAAWDSLCGATEAHFRLNGRTEWATITGWYNFIVAPAAVVPGGFPPVALTNVVFVPPATLPPALANQVYTLTYQLGETSSGEARAFLLRDDSLIFEQGKPAKDSTTVQLTDARLGDRLCVFDLNDHAESAESPRHQFGCESVVAGDSELIMTRDITWSPQITIEQTGPQQLSVTVKQPLAGGSQLAGRLIPETDAAGPPQTFAGSGDIRSAVFNLAEPVMPVYLQLWVEETPTAPQTRREVIADRGVGGNGAFGPARLYTGVLVVSSDGNASYQNDEPIELGPGESVAWQSMPGTPPMTPWNRISGQSYRLDAFPADLVAGGTVSIKYVDEFGVLSAAQAAAEGAALHFWDGSKWVPLPTTITQPAGAQDAILTATAPSQGATIYAVLIDSQPALFLPHIRN
jgi:hypothetical protein